MICPDPLEGFMHVIDYLVRIHYQDEMFGQEKQTSV